MNKTVTANISGVVFHIEADAYEKLHQYLNTIKNYFRDSDGTEEIMADIEARIAELFKEKLGVGRDVITMEKVQQVIEIMGEPEAYMDEENDDEYNNGRGSYRNERAQQTSFSSRKLYRDEDDNVLGGVCSGLGYYFGIDRIWLRIGFLVAVFGFGTGFLLYLILWAIIPKAKTTSEKLEMKGEPINVENIGNTIKDEFNNFKKKVENNDTRQFVQKTESAAMRFFIFLGNVLKFFFKFLGKIIGVAFIMAAVAGLVTLIVFLFSGPFDMTINNANFNHFWTTDISQLYFTSNNMFYLGLTGLIIVTVIPLLGIFYGGAKLLFNVVPSSNKTINLSAISLLVIGMILISISATTTLSDYSMEQRKTETIDLVDFTSDTMYLESIGNTYSAYRGGPEDVFIENDEIFMDEVEVDIVKSKSDEYEMRMRKSAHGRSRKLAGLRAENIMIDFEQEGQYLRISPLLSVPFTDRVRNQEVKISIGMPVGTTVYLTESANDIIYDIENETNMYDARMIGHFWKMTEVDGLVCTDCVKSDYRSGRVPKRLLHSELEGLEKLEVLIGTDKIIEIKELKGLQTLKELEKLSELDQLKELKKLGNIFKDEDLENLELKIKSNGSEISINL